MNFFNKRKKKDSFTIVRMDEPDKNEDEEDDENPFLFFDAQMKRRLTVLREVLDQLRDEKERSRLRKIALENVNRWSKLKRTKAGAGLDIRVLQDDWGAATQALTIEFGEIFATLNMANAYTFGGGYLTGMVAQEENMFRRTDCHFSKKGASERARTTYTQKDTDLLNAVNGRVYLDTDTPRICVRGPEIRTKKGMGYEKLPETEIFPFYELRAAAVDRRNGRKYSDEETLHRVRAQFETLKEKNVRHVVLSAFGCGAFRNPADKVAACYKKVLEDYKEDFDCVAFAIYHAGYGPNNYIPFHKVFFPGQDEI